MADGPPSGRPGPALASGRRSATRLRTLLDQVWRIRSDAGRLELTGGLVQLSQLRGYVVLREELERVLVPYRRLVGHHEDLSALRNVPSNAPVVGWVLQHGEAVGGLRVIYLDTRAAGGKHHGELCEARLSWLEQQLVEPVSRPVLIVIDHSPMEIGVPVRDQLRLLDSAGLAELIR